MSVIRRLRHATLVATFALTACDRVTDSLAPAASVTPPPSQVTPRVNSQWVSVGDTLVDVFTVPAGSTAPFTEDFGDGSAVTFPNGIASICDPATSSYGLGTWDSPCQPATRPITFKVKYWHEASGLPHVDFSPAVRFVPGRAGVTLRFHSPDAANAWLSSILYCDTPTSACVDESLADRSLRTHRDKDTGDVWRRIKHFSGYNVVAD